MVVPILLYGCEIWGISKINYQEAISYEKVHLKFIKEIKKKDILESFICDNAINVISIE